MPKTPKVKDPIAVALAAKRMTKLSPARRREIARLGARARWAARTEAPR